MLRDLAVMDHTNIRDDVERILITEKEIAACILRLASEIEEIYRHSQNKIVFVCVLKGSLVFLSDLIRKIKLPVEIDFIRASSYGSGTVTSGRVQITCDLDGSDFSGCDILLVEDILDTGNTLSRLIAHLREKGACSVRLCTLLSKPDRRVIDIRADFLGFEIPDEFVVGYGLDYNEKYRNLPYIGVLRKEVYSGSV